MKDILGLIILPFALVLVAIGLIFWQLKVIGESYGQIR